MPGVGSQWGGIWASREAVRWGKAGREGQNLLRCPGLQWRRHLARRGGCPAGKAGREDQNLLRFPGPNGEAFGPVGRMSDGEGLDTVNKAAEGNRRREGQDEGESMENMVETGAGDMSAGSGSGLSACHRLPGLLRRQGTGHRPGLSAVLGAQ